MASFPDGPEGCAFLDAARFLARALEDDPFQLSWRHHGVGMLQAELTDRLRVHVHHPDLVAMEEPRSVHDHRFDLVSAVLVGRLLDKTWQVISNDEGPFEIWAINHAKIQVGDGRDLRRIGRALAAVNTMVSFGAGTVYRIARREFHSTTPLELSVTVVHRSNFDDEPARVLSDRGVPESGIAHKPSELGDEHRRILRAAANALRISRVGTLQVTDGEIEQMARALQLQKGALLP